MGERASKLPPSSLLIVDGLIKLRMQRVFIGALRRQMSSCNQREMLFLEEIPMRESLVIITTRDVGKGPQAIIEFFSVTHTSKNFEGARPPGGACVRRRGAPVPRHNGQSKPAVLRIATIYCTKHTCIQITDFASMKCSEEYT